MEYNPEVKQKRKWWFSIQYTRVHSVNKIACSKNSFRPKTEGNLHTKTLTFIYGAVAAFKRCTLICLDKELESTFTNIYGASAHWSFLRWTCLKQLALLPALRSLTEKYKKIRLLFRTVVFTTSATRSCPTFSTLPLFRNARLICRSWWSKENRFMKETRKH